MSKRFLWPLMAIAIFSLCWPLWAEEDNPWSDYLFALTYQTSKAGQTEPFVTANKGSMPSSRALQPATPLDIKPTQPAGSLPAGILKNHFKAYSITPKSGNFFIGSRDQFMEDGLQLRGPFLLANPVKKDTFNIIDPDHHLSWYFAFGRDTLIEVNYKNQFESTTIFIDSVRFFLVPTIKFPHPAPDSLDHYKCYKIRDSQWLQKKPVMVDQFTDERADSVRRDLFCTPCQKTAGGITFPTFDTITHYVAYLIAPGQPLPFPFTRQTADQFVSRLDTVLGSKYLLVPTEKILPPPPPDTLKNHFKTWRLESLNIFHRVLAQDQFMTDSLTLRGLDFISNPVRKIVPTAAGNDTSKITRPNDHLLWYPARGRDTLLQVEYKNQFESTTVLIDTVAYFLVPTRKLPHPKPDSLLGHYKGYKIRNPQQFVKVIKLQDQFDSTMGTTETIDILKPLYFCTPARKNNEPVFGPDTHYVAYEIIPKVTTSMVRDVENQFGPLQVTVLNSELLLVPTQKIAFSAPTPPDTCLPPPLGMVAWWPLDETSGNMVFDEPQAGGNNNGMTMPGPIGGGGPTSVTGKVDGALYFPGPYVEVPDHPDLNFPNGSFSIDGWVNPVLVGSTLISPIVDKRDVSAALGYALYIQDSRLKLAINNIGFQSSPAITYGAWQHVAVTVDGSITPYAVTLYINGAPVAFTGTPSPLGITNSLPLWIGKTRVSGVGFGEIAIDELEIFNRALRGTEIDSLYQADTLGKCKTPDRNHFKTWRIFTPPIDTMVLTFDQFVQGSHVRLDSIDFISNPAIKIIPTATGNDTSDITRPNDHLTWYRIKNLSPLQTIKVEYINQFESTTVTIDTLKYLLVPTQKDPHPKPDSLLGHYNAYRIKNPPTFTQITYLQDQFDVKPETTDVLKPLYFLTPTIKNNEPAYGPDTHYVAYLIIPQRISGQARMTNDQFGQHSILVRNSELLLVPTKKKGFIFCTHKPNDCNGDGMINLTDIICDVNVVFKGVPKPVPNCRCDSNSDRMCNLSDIVYKVNYVFKGGPKPIPCDQCCIAP